VSVDTLTTYLQDHLAGSVVAIELLEHLARISTSSGSNGGPPNSMIG